MTWATFKEWLAAKQRQQQVAEPSPHSWAVQDPWFSDDAKRQRVESGRLG